MGTGRSVKLYLVDGVASGILTAEIMNWTGHVLAAPRTRIESVLKRDELARTGIYFLIGPDDQDSGLDRVYVGEGDEIGKRLYQHNKEKDFWERFIAVTSKDMNLTKAHVRYLEGRLISLLRAARKVVVENSTAPDFKLLPEADIADMEAFLEEVSLILPVIGITFLQTTSRKRPVQPKGIDSVSTQNNLEVTDYDFPASSVIFSLENKKAKISARAMEADGEFILLKGSVGSLKERESFHDRLKALRDEAFASGRARKIDDSNFIIEQDIALSSPSAAAVFLFGTSRNGRTDWLVEGIGQTYGDWKDNMIDQQA
ncbi:GIY-YIG nuclease family protein [Roseicyclus sp.]